MNHLPISTIDRDPRGCRPPNKIVRQRQCSAIDEQPRAEVPAAVRQVTRWPVPDLLAEFFREYVVEAQFAGPAEHER